MNAREGLGWTVINLWNNLNHYSMFLERQLNEYKQRVQFTGLSIQLI